MTGASEVTVRDASGRILRVEPALTPRERANVVAGRRPGESAKQWGRPLTHVPRQPAGPAPDTAAGLAVVAQVAAAHGVTVEDLLGRCQGRVVTRARAEAIRAVRGLGWSLPAVGALFGRDHKTVWHHCRDETLGAAG